MMCVLLLVILLIAFLIILCRVVNPYHVHSLVIRRDYEFVWQSFSDPLQYKKEQHSTLAIHVAKRWQGISLIGWIFHKNTVRKDFNNAKMVIENKIDAVNHPI